MFGDHKQLIEHMQNECEKIIRICLCCKIDEPTLILKMDQPCKKECQESRQLQQAIKDGALKSKLISQENSSNLKKLKESQKILSQAKEDYKKELKN